MAYRILLISGVALLALACLPSGAYAADPGTTNNGGNPGTVNNGGTPGGTVNGGGNPGGTVNNGGNPPSSEGVLQNPLNNIHSLPELLTAILDAVVKLGGILLTVMLVYVGFLFVMAQGNPEEISRARNALIWVLVGGLILLGAEAISQVVQATVKSLM